MSRAARITVGAVTAGCLLLVALIAGIMSAVSSSDGSFAEEMFFGSPDSEAIAEVLDVDEEFGYVTLDVRWTTDDGEVVVTYIDWVADEVPAVGDEVDVVYDAEDPEYTSYAADDPFVDEIGGSELAEEADDTEAAAERDAGVGEAAGWVALAAVVLLLPTVVVTVVAAVRAPAPRRDEQVMAYQGDPFAWDDGSGASGRPGHAQGYPTQGYATQGYSAQGYPAQGYAPAGQVAGYPGSAAPGYAPTGYAPPGYAPPGHAPTGYAPTGHAPTGYAPTGYGPPGQAPTGYPPTGQAPTGYAPPGQAPTRYPPTGQAPTGQAPTGNVPPGQAAYPGPTPPGPAPVD